MTHDHQILESRSADDQASALRLLMEEFSQPPDARFREPREPGRVVLIASGKGGVGKTSVAAGLAAGLARRNRRVLLVDADLRVPALHMLLDLDPPSTIEAALTRSDEPDALRRAAVRTAAGFWAVAGVRDAWFGREPTPEAWCALADALTDAAARFHAVLVDAGTGVSPALYALAPHADAIAVVATPSTPSQHYGARLIDALADALPPDAVVCSIASKVLSSDAGAQAHAGLRALLRSQRTVQRLGSVRADPRFAAHPAQRLARGRFGHDAAALACRAAQLLSVPRPIESRRWWQRTLGVLRAPRAAAVRG